MDEKEKIFHETLKAADQGDVKKMSEVANMYLQGFGVKQNYSLAYDYFLKAANKKDPAGLYGVGYLTYTGLGAYVKSSGVAIQYIKKSAKKHYPPAIYFLGFMHEFGEGTRINIKKAMKYYTLGYTKYQNKDCAFGLARIYEKEGNKTEALRYLDKAEELGSADAMNLLAKYHYQGINYPKNSISAKNHALKAYKINQADELSLYILGEYYYLKYDYEEAYNFYSLSSELGNLDARAMKNFMIAKGEGVNKDSVSAEKELLKLKDLNNPLSMTLLGMMYRDGNFGYQDFKKAGQCFVEGAKLNYPPAKYNLAIYARDGFGIASDFEQYKNFINYCLVDAYYPAEKEFERYYFGKDSNQELANEGLKILDRLSREHVPFEGYIRGKLYLEGKWIKQNIDLGLYELEHMEYPGHKDGLYLLASIYEEGKYRHASRTNAIKLYRRSAFLGNKKALDKLQEYGEDVSIFLD